MKYLYKKVGFKRDKSMKESFSKEENIPIAKIHLSLCEFLLMLNLYILYQKKTIQ
jgi:hypothetical protein